jgi:dienelactone hydrolase
MHRAVTIWSEGTRLAADLWQPDGLAAGERCPGILLCHGWGGTKEHLNATYAPWFSKAGFVVLAFDYRGWGESDAKLDPLGEPPTPDENGEVTLRARAVRDVVDPFDQLRDIQNCLDWLVTEPHVDAERVGLWGTSYGGGHVCFMAAHDPRVKAIVAQVSAQQPAEALVAAGIGQQRASARARGEIGPTPPDEDAVEGLGGRPDLAKMIHYRPIATADHVRVPTLVIDAEEEELFDRSQHGHALYEIVRRHAPAAYETFPCKHYAIYDQYYRAASTRARDWFVEHLGGAKA